MITVQPIRYTSQAAGWHRLAQALGFTPAFPPHQLWSEFDGDGILAIHHVEPGSADDATCGFHLLADDLDAVADRLATAGVEVERRQLADIGPMLVVPAGSQAFLTISEGKRAARSGPVTVQPIWYAAELHGPQQVLDAIGLRPRLVADSGVWLDFTADGGGLAALHRDPSPRIELSLEYGDDLEALVERLDAAGFSAAVVDEAYNRTVRVATPDGDDLWVNGARDDLYGYTRAQADPARG